LEIRARRHLHQADIEDIADRPDRLAAYRQGSREMRPAGISAKLGRIRKRDRILARLSSA
jgi:hypothetical protein